METDLSLDGVPGRVPGGRGEVARDTTAEGGTLDAGVEAAGVEAIEGGGVRGEENSTQMLWEGNAGACELMKG